MVGGYGIFADFGTKIVGALNEAVTSVAASLSGGLAAKGPIPNREKNQLLITSTAVGSFGNAGLSVRQDSGWASTAKPCL